MKFTDGNWMFLEGVTARYASRIYSWKQVGNELILLVPAKQVHHRGDTLDGPLLTITVSAPAPNVLRVKISHFEGELKNFPDLCEMESGDLRVRASEDSIIAESGDLSVRFSLGDQWHADFLFRDQLLCTSGERSVGLINIDGKGKFLHEQFTLRPDEKIYGLGERFTPFVKNGQVVDIWNKDGGASSEQAYKNIPFFLSSRGYGVFVNDSGPVSLEIGSEKTSKVQWSVPGNILDYCVIGGENPKEIVSNYGCLTGLPTLPPAWTFGLWLSTSFTTDYDEDTVTHFVDGMKQRDIPLSVFHFDCFWMKAFHWCDFQWDETFFPDPVGFLGRLKQKGLKISVWINSYIAQASQLFEAAKQNGYLLKTPSGGVWQTDQWQAGMGIVDFTNPEARSWFCESLNRLMDEGVDAFKTDFGERIPTDACYFDGSDPVKMHNYYPYIYNKTVFECLEKRKGHGKAVVFARSATAGCQKFPVHWGGDCLSNFEAMAETLRAGLSLGLCGFGFWSHDIGGFEGNPDPAVYKRWIQFGLLSSHSRLHGSGSYRVPWNFDEEAVDVLRFFTKLKCRLMPTLWSAAKEASESALPMLRAMLLEFPDDPITHYLDMQYMLGGQILVAPVMNRDGAASYYLPTGKWTHLLDDRQLDGSRWVQESYGFESLPIWVRPNSVVVFGSQDHQPDYDYLDSTEFHVYGLEVGKSCAAKIYNADCTQAAEFSCERISSSEYKILVSGQVKTPKAIFHTPEESHLDPKNQARQSKPFLLRCGAQEIVAPDGLG